MSSLLRWSVYLFFIILMISPYIIILAKSGMTFSLDFNEALNSMYFTVTQAVLSSVASMIGGALAAFSLLGMEKKIRKKVLLLLVLPSLFPTLFVILAAFNLFSNLGGFPYGLYGITLIHVAINLGLTAAIMERVLTRSLPRVSDLALVEGCSKWKFFWVAGVKMHKSEWVLLFFFLFALFFSSFSVPLLAGDLKTPVIEVLIFEKIRAIVTWPDALALSAMQMVLLLAFGFFLTKPIGATQGREADIGPLVPSFFGVVPGLAITAIIFLGNIQGLHHGWLQLSQIPQWTSWLGRMVFGTVVVGLGVGSLVAILLMGIVWTFPSPKFQKFLLAYVTPSSVLVGFSLLIVPPHAALDSIYYLKMVVGVVLISLSICYRLNIEESLSKLFGQVEVAKTLGADQWLIYKRVLFPQMKSAILYSSGLAAFWACGDYALSSVVSGRDLTLALNIKMLLGSYRIEVATLLTWIMMLVGSLILFLFWGGAYVSRNEFK